MVPSPIDQPLPLDVEKQIDRVSDEFERAWKAGQVATHRRLSGSRAGRRDDHVCLKSCSWWSAICSRRTGDKRWMSTSYRQRFPGSEAVVRRGSGPARAAQTGGPSARLLDPIASQGPTRTSSHRSSPDRAVSRFGAAWGKGGFGVVYLAHDPGWIVWWHSKVPRSELLATGQQRENFLHEARTAAKLKHPALVTVYEVQQDDDQIYIVQEYIEGQNLAEWAAAQSRSWEEITRRMIEITTAIGYVHQQGFYHRDLKPGNILIDNEGHAHVADFGLAVHEDALRMLKGKAPGTPPYMSPEQMRGETHWIDGRTDIWALGVILYELLAGHRPFAADEPVGTVRGDSGAGSQIAAHEEPDDPQGAGADLPEMSRQATHASLRQRIGSAGRPGGFPGDLHGFGRMRPLGANPGVMTLSPAPVRQRVQ